MMEGSGIIMGRRVDARGLDEHVPLILRDGELYDADLDRFFLYLPMAGVKSRFSLRAYAYDIVVWLRFLEACGKTIWCVDYEDVEAYHRIRRRGEPDLRITAVSWNRAIAALVRLYSWGHDQGLIARPPFVYRTTRHIQRTGRRIARGDRNIAYEPGARRANVRFVTMADYRAFRDIGLMGGNPDGTVRPGSRDRTAMRNALFADLMVSTGLRLGEAAGLTAAELSAIARDDRSRQLWLQLPPPLTKGDRGRSVLISCKLLNRISAYIAVERAHAVTKFRHRRGWEQIDRPIMVRPAELTRMLRLCTPLERSRLVLCDDKGTPCEPAALWLTEVGMPASANSWQVFFRRASERCTANGFALSVSPHNLRHTFAVHMLALLIQRQFEEAALPAGSMESYRLMLGDPLQHLQRLLGHASITTTYIYLDHVASRSDTVDTAVEELLALLSDGAEP